MGFKYYLRQSFLGNIPVLELREHEYEELVRAKGILSEALSIEEKYDLVLGNFIDFERELLMITMEGMTDHSFDYDRAYAIISVLNRRVANFITSGKGYTELISSMASKCVTDKDSVATKVKAHTSKLYDSSLEYRFAEALRNHIAHSADAVHSVSTPSDWSMDNQNRADTLTFNLEVFSVKERLQENSSFKKSVLIECEEKIDLKKVARKYMGAISELQDEVRKLIKDSVGSARALIEYYTGRYGDLNNGETFGLAAFSQSATESGNKPVSISLVWDDVRMKLEQKNQSISNMDRRCISSAIVKAKKK